MVYNICGTILVGFHIYRTRKFYERLLRQLADLGVGILHGLRSDLHVGLGLLQRKFGTAPTGYILEHGIQAGDPSLLIELWNVGAYAIHALPLSRMHRQVEFLPLT